METELQDSYDVIIAGAGPAGSSLAIRLANSALSVLLVEQKNFPREKLCGEFISPECLVHFEDLGISSGISVSGGTSLMETVFYSRNGKGLSVKSEWFGSAGSIALGLSRAAMDSMLLERARHVGVTVSHGTSVGSLMMDKERVVGVTIRDNGGKATNISSKLTVDATGRTRSLARRLESTVERKAPAKHVAFKTHIRGADISDRTCEIYVYRGGYGGCNRVEDDLHNLCFIVSAEDTRRLKSEPDRVMREVVFTNKRARAAMKNAVVAKPWLAVPIERFGRGELVPAEGLIAVGDAAAFMDPFTGSGILMALESSRIAHEAIVRGINRNFEALASDYKREYSLTFDSRLRVCSILRHAAFAPLLAEASIALLSKHRGLSRRLARATRFSA